MTRLQSESALEALYRCSSSTSFVLGTRGTFLIPTATVRCCEIERPRRRNSQLSVLSSDSGPSNVATLAPRVATAFIRVRSPGYQTGGGNAATSLPLFAGPPPSRVKRRQQWVATVAEGDRCQLYSMPRRFHIPVVKIHYHVHAGSGLVPKMHIWGLMKMFHSCRDGNCIAGMCLYCHTFIHVGAFDTQLIVYVWS